MYIHMPLSSQNQRFLALSANHAFSQKNDSITSTSHIALELVASVFWERPEVRRNTLRLSPYLSAVRNFSCSAWNMRTTSPWTEKSTKKTSLLALGQLDKCQAKASDDNAMCSPPSGCLVGLPCTPWTGKPSSWCLMDLHSPHDILGGPQGRGHSHGEAGLHSLGWGLPCRQWQPAQREVVR